MNQTAPEDTPPLPPPGKLLASAEIISLADHAAKRAAKLGTVIDGLEAGIASRGEDAAKSAAAAGFPPEDQASAARTRHNAPFAGFDTTQVAATAGAGFVPALIQGNVLGDAYSGPGRGA